MQLERYRAAGDGAQLVAQDTRRLVIRVREDVPDPVIEELVAVEQGCCPFLDLGWEPKSRRLTVAVAREEHERALGAIAYALGLDRTG